MKLLRLAALAAGIAAVVAFVGVGLPSSGHAAAADSKSITVTGSGSVTAVPTQAQFAFGVSTRGTTAAGALASDSTQMRKLIDALKAAGIPAASIQTSQVSLSPQTSNDGNTIVGYEASNSVSVTIASIANAGAIVDTAVGAGANQVDGPNLTVADQSALYDKALKDAVADARTKADALASASGLTVGAVTTVEEQTGSPTPVQFSADAAAPSATPIEAGSQQITATVTVTFDAS
ncbi:MAG TPA: SIMPL domain-containing protein [Gaiellaceae bacterium]|nr:SIMPL domain-containing protein [Gaiellaceae bacterium]